MGRKKEKKTLSYIFEAINEKKDKFEKIYSSWNFNSLDKFVISFERLTEQENIDTSKRFGNIAKKITKKILEEDMGCIDPETNKKYTKKEILDYINLNSDLKSKFKKLYEEISKRNFWKLHMPLISTQYDLLLDRCNNDYERFKIIHKFYIQEKTINAKDVATRKKVKLKALILKENYEHNEIEKVFYILINKIKRKRDGKEFLNSFNLDLQNPFEKK